MKKVKTNQFSGSNCVLFVLMFRFLATHGQWPTVWPYGQAEAMENWPVDETPVWGTDLRDQKGNLRGALKQYMLTHRKKPFKDRKVIATSEWIYWCAP